jgi:hypothetical protein
LQEKQNSFLRADNDLRKELESIEKQVGSLCDEAGLQRVKAAEFSLLPSLIASKKSEVELQLKQVNDEILHLKSGRNSIRLRRNYTKVSPARFADLKIIPASCQSEVLSRNWQV